MLAVQVVRLKYALLLRQVTVTIVIFRRRLHQLTGRNARCAGDS
jgi:hypothetical protein